MKRIIACVLCALMLFMSMPTWAVADSAYSTISNKNVQLEYPEANSYYATPQRATVKASKSNGSIYFMPTPKDGNGVLGTVANGTEVTIYAEQSGFYFFMTADGRAGWNGAKFFKLLGPVSGYTSNDGILFNFNNGATVVLPSSFISTGVDRDSNNANVNFYYIDPDQDMELTLTEIDTTRFYQSDSEHFNSIYNTIKDSYPSPTYDDPKITRFDLSGYTGNYIYYFKGVLSNQVIYLIQMFYPTRNRSVCDRYVEAITGSFSEYGSSLLSSGGTSTLTIPTYPTSPYTVALRKNLVDGVYYSDVQKKDVINDTYYSRKDSKGDRQDWYTSATYDDPNTGYQIGFYYADGLVFFADAYYKGEKSSVTFYFWGDQLLCVHDLRGNDKKLHYAGSEKYNSIVREFGDMYAKAVSLQPAVQTPSTRVSSSANENNKLFDETYWFMSGDGGVNFTFYGLFHKDGTFTARSFMDGESYGKYYSGTYVYQNNTLTLSFYWFDYYGEHYSFISDGYGGFYDPGDEPGAGFYIQPLEDSLIKYYYSNSSNDSLASSNQTRKFIHGGQIQIPNSFRDVSTDELRALHGYFYDYYDNVQDMTISLSEVMALEYPEGESKVIQSEYDFLKRTQPKATYATKSDDAFTLSGYSGDNIYYIHYKLSHGVVYTVSFLYPTANRDVCDCYVEQVIESFNVK